MIDDLPLHVRLVEVEHTLHLWRPHFTRTVCGLDVDGASAAPDYERVGCPCCRRIAEVYLRSGAWEGFGVRAPGRAATAELCWYLHV